jgi:hypothetical protein
MPEEIVVHLLLYGLPRCRFSTEVPAAWPKGHKWVPKPEDLKLKEGEKACAECVRLEFLASIGGPRPVPK